MDLLLFFLFGALAPVIAVCSIMAAVAVAVMDIFEVFTRREKIIIETILLSIVVFCFHLGVSYYSKDLSDLGYETGYEEVQASVTVNHIIREKGKEPMYELSIDGSGVTIPESVYEEYIGDGNNAVTLKKAWAEIYEGHTYPLGIRTSFSGESLYLRTLYEDRISYPWEEDVAPYTEKDARQLAEAYLDGDIKTDGSTTADVSKDIKLFE